ncbi:MAG: bacillithiol biosynthesis cysteine-adding enzyme BshC [Ignavibacteriales bacterium]|nr:bacillithiol biosynthesis cysteine-adding enzyme BshC [Ignavibacteriales bacterium]
MEYLGGPLYTIYKIITAIRLANQLTERYDEFKFVPVFWLRR